MIYDPRFMTVTHPAALEDGMTAGQAATCLVAVFCILLIIVVCVVNKQRR